MQNSLKTDTEGMGSVGCSSEVNYAAILDKPVLTSGAPSPASRHVRGAKVDFASQRVVSLPVSDEKRPRCEVSAADVQAVDQRGVTITSDASLRPLTHGGGLLVFAKQGRLIGAQVVSPRGAPIGKIVNFVFRLMDGFISTYEVSQGFFKDLLKGRCLLSPDEVTGASLGELVVKE